MRKNDNIQYLRAIAALLVVLYHSAGVFSPDGYLKPLAAEQIFRFGHAGVELFFVISGYIIYHAHSNDEPTLFYAKHYAARRVARVYPIVILAVTIAAVARWLARDPLSPAQIFGSYTLIPVASCYPTVLWTLRHEMLFYAFFLLFYLSPQRITLLVVVAAVVSTFGYFVFQSAANASDALVILASPYNLLFAMGMLIRRFFGPPAPITRPAVAVPCGVAGALLFVAVSFVDLEAHRMLDDDVDALRLRMRLLTLGYGVASALIVTASVSAAGLFSGTLRSALLFLGNASYSIYLFHIFPIQIIGRKIAGFYSPEWHYVLFVAIVIGALATGSLFYLIVERPLMGALNRRIRRILAELPTAAGARSGA